MEPRNEEIPYDVRYEADWLDMVDEAEGTSVDHETSEALREQGYLKDGDDDYPWPEPQEWDWADWLAEGDAQAMRAELDASKSLRDAAAIWAGVAIRPRRNIRKELGALLDSAILYQSQVCMP